MVAEIEVTRAVPAPPDRIFAYLSDLENHWRLADRWIEVVSLERPPGAGPEAPAVGGTVRMRGPLGLGRTAATKVLSARPPGSIAGSAELGRTLARVSWTLADREGQTDVTLAAGVERAGPLDGLLLRLGGRIWLRRRFASVLERLAERFARSGEGRDDSLAPS
jgi:hypothetical protein